jgi:probable phosphoglycerate mutase
MKKIIKICLIRHGETDWNRAGRMQGQTNTPLNANGILQAELTAKSIQKTGHLFNAIFTSDLMRAYHTAEIIGNHLGLSPIKMTLLKERHVGALQGLLTSEASEVKPDIWKAHTARQLDHDLDGGESITTFSNRVSESLNTILKKNLGQSILVISHGGVLDMLYRIVMQQKLTEKRKSIVPNTSLNWISYDGAQWSIDKWADVSHLPKESLDSPDF